MTKYNVRISLYWCTECNIHAILGSFKIITFIIINIIISYYNRKLSLKWLAHMQPRPALLWPRFTSRTHPALLLLFATTATIITTEVWNSKGGADQAVAQQKHEVCACDWRRRHFIVVTNSHRHSLANDNVGLGYSRRMPNDIGCSKSAT